ncbi:MAG: MaoC family dehydratase N-terminal domain-containing protein [Alicyclobacillus macrosporangiidus]|uniref:MaoC/PaaZ C-terminal domain-containing protein n=1 Tax=Alicyclobacillus macrosporangiidus TaxID=392015 RepID=UPI0026E9583D|nr:MaoC/PaaZ C-terminal domain-containing protein [Alicyclobacillus macrosporangiidus]MCL6600793.1 MaoC family dehydratase N-terminal domain-containing protein [Alicyclobacillus macrosporangiidus]
MASVRRFQVGDTLGPLVKPSVTKTQLVMYSGASGDFNPIHTVDEYAKEAGLGGVIAHGMLTMAFVGQLLTETAGAEGALKRFGVRFVEMVRPGDTIVCEGRVTGVEEQDGQQVVTCDVWATIEGSGRNAVTGQAVFTAPLPEEGMPPQEDGP